MKEIKDMTYSEFCEYIDGDGYDRFEHILGYDDFSVYKDAADGKYYYLEEGENDASDFFEVELIAQLTHSGEHDLKLPSQHVGERMSVMFDCDCCGEQVRDDDIVYLWFKRKSETPPDEYIPKYTLEEAKEILQSLTPWKIDWGDGDNASAQEEE